MTLKALWEVQMALGMVLKELARLLMVMGAMVCVEVILYLNFEVP